MTRSHNWRVGRAVDNGRTMVWHRGRRRQVLSLHGVIITFRTLASAEARAGALNLADARASQVAEAKAVTP